MRFGNGQNTFPSPLALVYEDPPLFVPLYNPIAYRITFIRGVPIDRVTFLASVLR